MNALPHATPSPHGLSRGGLIAVVVVHLAIFWGLVQTQIITLPDETSVLSVSLITPTAALKPQPVAPPPQTRPTPVERRPVPVKQPAQLAAAAETPAEAPVAVAPAPTPAPPAAAAPVAAPPAPPSTTPPHTNADYLNNPKPSYPPLSRRLGEQGRVVLRVFVDAGGNPGEIQLHTSSGYSRLDQSALETVRRWKFAPARRGQEATAAWVQVPIVFNLKE